MSSNIFKALKIHDLGEKDQDLGEKLKIGEKDKDLGEKDPRSRIKIISRSWIKKIYKSGLKYS